MLGVFLYLCKMKPHLLASYLTFFFAFLIAFAIYLQKYHPDFYLSVFLFILSWALVGVIWMGIYVAIHNYKSKRDRKNES